MILPTHACMRGHAGAFSSYARQVCIVCVRYEKKRNRSIYGQGVGNVAVVEPKARCAHEHGPVIRVLLKQRVYKYAYI